MAYDEMHAVMCRILRYLYDCMRAGEDADLSKVSPSALGIPQPYWENIWAQMARAGYVDGVGYTDSCRLSANVVCPTATIAGVEFLQENSAMRKAAKILSEVRGFIPV